MTNTPLVYKSAPSDAMSLVFGKYTEGVITCIIIGESLVIGRIVENWRVVHNPHECKRPTYSSKKTCYSLVDNLVGVIILMKKKIHNKKGNRMYLTFMGKNLNTKLCSYK